MKCVVSVNVYTSQFNYRYAQRLLAPYMVAFVQCHSYVCMYALYYYTFICSYALLVLLFSYMLICIIIYTICSIYILYWLYILYRSYIMLMYTCICLGNTRMSLLKLISKTYLRPLLIDRVARKVERRKSREFTASQNPPYSGGKGENFKCLIFY